MEVGDVSCKSEREHPAQIKPEREGPTKRKTERKHWFVLLIRRLNRGKEPFVEWAEDIHQHSENALSTFSGSPPRLRTKVWYWGSKTDGSESGLVITIMLLARKTHDVSLLSLITEVLKVNEQGEFLVDVKDIGVLGSALKLHNNIRRLAAKKKGQQRRAFHLLRFEVKQLMTCAVPRRLPKAIGQ